MSDVPAQRSAEQLAVDLRTRAAALTGEAWEVPATAAMMREAATWLSPTPDQVLEGDDACVERVVAAIRGAFSTTGGAHPRFTHLVDVESVVRFILLRLRGTSKER